MKRTEIPTQLRFDEQKKEVLNHLNAVICEVLPREDRYAGNYEIRLREMVIAWNCTYGSGIDPKALHHE